jgi:hypothetical protein
MIRSGGSTADAVDCQDTPRRNLLGEIQHGPFVRPEPAGAIARFHRYASREVDQIDVLMTGPDIGELNAGWST